MNESNLLPNTKTPNQGANWRLAKYKLGRGAIAMRDRDRILIIEDDPAVGKSLRDSPTSNGFHVEWKSSGGKGISHAQR